MTLEFTVIGVAIPKGSTRSFIVQGANGPRAATTADNPKTKGWQHLIAAAAAMALRRDPVRFTSGPVYVAAVFYLPRPKALLTKQHAPRAIPHTKKPDTDKLARSLFDALSGVAWTDDAQVTDMVIRKRYCAAADVPRAVVRVRAAHVEGGLL